MTGPGAKQERTEFGYHPTECHCPACIRQCEFISGCLVPADLPRWRAHFGVKENTDLMRLLLASPGALVSDGVKQWRIRTLVPDRTRQGACVFLSSEKRCTIHSVAGFGCRFFDEHMPAFETNRRSVTAHLEIAKDWHQGGPYSTLWVQLNSMGRIAEPPEVLRARIALAARASSWQTKSK